MFYSLRKAFIEGILLFGSFLVNRGFYYPFESGEHAVKSDLSNIKQDYQKSIKKLEL